MNGYHKLRNRIAELERQLTEVCMDYNSHESLQIRFFVNMGNENKIVPEHINLIKKTKWKQTH